MPVSDPRQQTWDEVLAGARAGEALAWSRLVAAFDQLRNVAGIGDGGEPYFDGTGQLVWVHSAKSCDGARCVVHCPSDHGMRDYPTHFRADRGFMERVCPHGVGHPDPDSMDFVMRTRGVAEMIQESTHGCDGCCRPPGHRELPA